MKATTEAAALRQAGDRARGGTLYVTLEPCSTTGRTPPCTDAILQAGVARVVVGCVDPNPRHAGRGTTLLREAGVEVVDDVLADACRRILRPFVHWIRTQRPYVTLKLGMSMDGRIADGKGHSKWITSEASRRVVQELRRAADGILVGAGTVRADNPSLLCLSRPLRGPYRIVAASKGRLPVRSRILIDEYARKTIVAVNRTCPPRRRASIGAEGATVTSVPAVGGGISLRALLKRLGRMGLLHVLCEGGGEMADGLIRAGLVNRYVFFLAPVVLGGGAVPAVGGRGWGLRSMPRLVIEDVERCGDDVMVTAYPERRRGR